MKSATQNATGAVRRATWGPIVAGYYMYAGLFVCGAVLHSQALNIAGGLAMFAAALSGNASSFATARVDSLGARALLLALLLLALAACAQTPTSAAIGLKYALIFLLFWRVHAWDLPPIELTRWRRPLFAAVLAVVLISLASGRSFVAEGESRLSGLFPNPNNFALYSLALLFFANAQDSRLRHTILNAAVVLALVVSGTSGALVAYACGTAYRATVARRMNRAALLSAALLGGLLLYFSGEHSPLARLDRQVRAAVEFAGQDTADPHYGSLVDEHGVGSTSGAWRLAMWRRVFDDYASASPLALLLGRGFGTSIQRFGNVPHNDYVRILSEGGLLTLMAVCWFFAGAWKRMAANDRWHVAIFGIYSVTENNIDNFAYMALLMLAIASSVSRARRERACAQVRRNASHGGGRLRLGAQA